VGKDCPPEITTTDAPLGGTFTQDSPQPLQAQNAFGNSPAPGFSTPPPALPQREIQAAIYEAAGLPKVFTEASFIIPDIGASWIEAADSILGFANPGLVEITYWIDNGQGGAPIAKKETLLAGWGPLHLKGAVGSVCSIKANRPIFLYTVHPADNFIFGLDRALLISRMVAPNTSRRRVPILSRNVREALIPKTPLAVQSNPETMEQWANFMRMISR
jgi:hypothetical protein